MAEPFSAYHENLFQWIWEQVEFDCGRLQTDCGKSITIGDVGRLNHGAGPDFLQARLIINGMEWFGAVEVHKSSADWFRHNHHLDPNFNNVILHVVYFDEGKRRAKTEAGSAIYTLTLKDRLHKSLQNLLEIKQSKQLPCGGNVSFINQKAFEKQIRIAHNHYFEYKVKELLNGYPADKPLSAAWKWCMLNQIFSTLGIPGNREPMQQFCNLLLEAGVASLSLEECIQEAEAVAFGGSSLNWVHSGMRPASRPEKRIKQAAAIYYSVLNLPFGEFFQSPHQSWGKIVQGIPKQYRAGNGKEQLLFYTNFLPALYLLGDLLRYDALCTTAKHYWMESRQFVPNEIKKPFQQAGFSLEANAGKLGLAHQFKRFCSERNCHRCEVFKSAIRS